MPSGPFERFGERKITGSMFSALSSSRKVVALRLPGEEKVLGSAVEDVRLRFILRAIERGDEVE